MSKRASKSRIADYFRSVYQSHPAVITRAPGRIEFIGNHTDYNGGLVAGAAIDRSILVAAGIRTDRILRFASEFSTGTASCELDAIRKIEGKGRWANYPLGVYTELAERGLRPDAGFNLAIMSDLPSGAGLSSSAALELSTALAIGTLYGMTLSRADLVQIGRSAENKFLGVPTGPLDQSVCAHGRENHLVFIDCRTLEADLVPVPPECRIRIFNTGTKHSLLDSLYSKRHSECTEALRLLREAHPELEYLTDAKESYLDELPGDAPPEVVKRARHVIRETERVRATREALYRGDIERTGKLMHESHESSRTLFENSCPELDTLSDLLNAHPRVHGARLSGGGFGGAAIALTSEAFGDDDATAIREEYRKAYNHFPDTLACAITDGAEVLQK